MTNQTLPYRLLPVDESSADDEDILLEVDKTIGIVERFNVSEEMDRQMLLRGRSVRKPLCSWRNHWITNTLCMVCVLLLLVNIVVINFTVKHALQWMEDQRNHGNSTPEDSGSSGNSHQVIYSLRDSQRLVHLDLKGGPPKMGYLKQLIPWFTKLGATGVLIEYEDMFPYHNSLDIIAAGNAYTLTDIQTIQETCVANNLTVIPLVQTFGHMEFMLKYKKYEALREVAAYPEFLNPRLRESDELVYEMIDQMIKAHPGSLHIHIGCDEVSVITDAVYLDHVTKVARYVRTHHQGVTVIIWDDMLRKTNISLLQQYNISSLVEPMVWVYLGSIEERVTHQVWDMYSQVFSSVWIASAFKGAEAPWMYYTDVGVYLSNHLAWLRTLGWLNSTHPRLRVAGLALTGWSRYDHLASLCDLLPTGLPSLALCLQVVIAGQYNPGVLQFASSLLHCKEPFPVTFNSSVHRTVAPQCAFPGHRIYELTTFTFRDIVVLFNDDFIQIPTARSLGRINPFSLAHNFSSPYKLQRRVLTPVIKLRKMLFLFKGKIGKELEKVFYPDLVKEWTEEYLDFISQKLDRYNSQAEALSARREWPNRPLS